MPNLKGILSLFRPVARFRPVRAVHTSLNAQRQSVTDVTVGARNGTGLSKLGPLVWVDMEVW